MMDTRIIAILLVLVIALAAFAYVAYEAYAPAKEYQTTTVQNSTLNGTVSLTNSSSLNSYNGTSGNESISNTTLNGNVTRDQNYSTLSNGNIISSP